jgi:hypothetical protein
MELRKERDVEDILDFIKEKWQLNVVEEEVLDSVFNVFAKQRVKEMKQIEYLLNGETEELLETLYQRDIECYACDEFDLIPANSEHRLEDALEDLNFNWASKITDEDMIESLEADGWKVTLDNEEFPTDFDYVDDTYFREIWEKFESLDWAGRKELRDKIVDYER